MTQSTPGATALTIFNFQSHAVRIILRDGEPWFVADDVAAALEYHEAASISRVLDEDEAAPHNLRIRSDNGVEQDRELTLISESGLYHAVLKSRKPKAKPFRRWITGEVLPAIRKTGRYEILPSVVDIRALLTAGLSEPTLAPPAEIRTAINRKAWNLAHDAYELFREHLKRNIAFQCEMGYPDRELHEERAMKIIDTTTLDSALTNRFLLNVESIAVNIRFLAQKTAAYRDEIVGEIDRFKKGGIA
jgi:prophage antirepressor-like protein